MRGRNSVNSYMYCYYRHWNSRIHLTSPPMSTFSRSCKEIATCHVFARFCWAPFYLLTSSNTWIFQCHQSLRFLQSNFRSPCSCVQTSTSLLTSREREISLIQFKLARRNGNHCLSRQNKTLPKCVGWAKN